VAVEPVRHWRPPPDERSGEHDRHDDRRDDGHGLTGQPAEVVAGAASHVQQAEKHDRDAGGSDPSQHPERNPALDLRDQDPQPDRGNGADEKQATVDAHQAYRTQEEAGQQGVAALPGGFAIECAHQRRDAGSPECQRQRLGVGAARERHERHRQADRDRGEQGPPRPDDTARHRVDGHEGDGPGHHVRGEDGGGATDPPGQGRQSGHRVRELRAERVGAEPEAERGRPRAVDPGRGTRCLGHRNRHRGVLDEPDAGECVDRRVAVHGDELAGEAQVHKHPDHGCAHGETGRQHPVRRQRVAQPQRPQRGHGEQRSRQDEPGGEPPERHRHPDRQRECQRDEGHRVRRGSQRRPPGRCHRHSSP
jgi:hypothetical protein